LRHLTIAPEIQPGRARHHAHVLRLRVIATLAMALLSMGRAYSLVLRAPQRLFASVE